MIYTSLISAVIIAGAFILPATRNHIFGMLDSRSTINKYNENAMDPEKREELSRIEELRSLRFERAGVDDPYEEAAEEMRRYKDEIYYKAEEEYRKYGEPPEE